MNLFSSIEDLSIRNIVTGFLIPVKEKNMLLQSISNGHKAYNEFVKSQLESYFMLFRKA